MFNEKLENGLEFCIEKIPGDFVTISYCINAGAFDEPIENLGIAHLVEHLVFKGTANRRADDIFKDINKLGGELNAYTTETNTVFYVTILKEYWKEAIDVLSDIVWNCIIPEEEFEREKNVVLEELKMYYDDGSRRVLDITTKTAFSKTPNKWNNGGTIESVSKISRQDVFDFIDNYYVADNIVLYVSGDIDFKEFIQYVDNYTKNISFSQTNRFRDDSKNVTIENTSESIDSTQSHMVMYFPFVLEEENIKNIFILNMVEDIFGNGFCSRLMELREKYGYAYTIYCNDFITKPESIMHVYIGLNKDNIENAKKMMIEKMEEIHKNGATEEEFNTAYNSLLTAMKRRHISTSSLNDFRVSMRGNGIVTDDVDFDDVIKELDTITLKDVNDFYAKFFIPKKASFVELIQTK